MAHLSPNLTTILSVNGLNTPIIIQRLAEWIKKNDSNICCLQVTYSKYNNIGRLEVKGWENDITLRHKLKESRNNHINIHRKENNQKHRGILYNDKRSNPPKYAWTKKQNCEIQGRAKVGL